MIALRALALAALFLIPGWLAVSLLRGGKGGLDGHERLFAAASLGVGLVSAAALILSLASIYSLPALLLLVGVVCVALAVVVWRKVAWPARLGAKVWLLPLAVMAVALVLSAPPGRTVLGWSDVGVYPDIAANIEREGGIAMEVATVREVAPERRDILYRPNDDPSRKFQAYENKAYFITDFDSGEVTPQFYYLWPCIMAVFASFLGLDAMFWAVTAMAILGLWGLLLLARRLLGWRWGLAAAALGAFSPLFIYFSRYGTSEMMNMALFIAASLFLTAYLRIGQEGELEGDAGLAATASFFFALGFLCRIDFLMVLAPLALFYLGKRMFKGLTRPDWWFCGLTMAGAMVATVVGAVFSAPYFSSLLGWITQPAKILLSPIGLALALFVLAFIFARRIGPTARRLAGARWVWTALLWLCLAAVFIYLYYIRPGSADNLIDYGVINPIQGPSFISQTLVRWAWYFSLAGLLLVFAGYGLWFSRRRSLAELPVMMMGISVTLVYGLNMRCTPMHILTMRRLVPVILPVAVLAAAYCLKSLVDMGEWAAKGKAWGEIAAKVAAGGLLLYLLLYAVNASIPIFGLEEGGNQLELSGEIAGSMEKDALVLMDYHLGDLFGPPLRSFYGVENAWLMENDIMEDEEFLALLADLGFPERPVYLLWRPGISGRYVPLIDGLALEETGDLALWEETLVKSFEERPDRREYDREDIWLLQVTEGGPDAGL